MITEFGKELRKIRMEKDICQNAMADILGITAPHLSSVENGRRPVTENLMFRLKDKFDLTESEMERLQRTSNNTVLHMSQFPKLFRSKEEAEVEWNKLLVHQELKRYAKGHGFSRDEHNYKLVYEPEFNEVNIAYDTDQMSPMDVYFGSHKDAENAIYEIGETRLIEEYFGIKEE